MKHWTIRQKIIGSFAVILTTMIFMGGFAYTRLAIIEAHAANMQTNSLPGLYYSSQMLSLWSQKYSIAQELGIQQDKVAISSLIRELQDSRTKLDAAITNYAMTSVQAMNADMNAHESDEHRHFDAFKNALGPYIAVQDAIVELTSDLKNGSAIQRMTREQLDPEYEKVRDLIKVLVDDNRVEADEAAVLIAGTVATARIDILTGIFVALALAVVCAFYTLSAVTRPLRSLVEVMDQMRQGNFTQRVDRRDEFGALGQAFNRMADELTLLFGQVQKSGIQVTTSVTEISATSREQQATANEIAATTTQIGATSREICATSKELVRTMNEVSLVAEQTATLAGGGQSGVSRMEETMQHVVEAAGSINAKLAVLNEKAGNINQVVTTITKVADQTNLLSLNAAIEAEKAGEYGRGFAVVASEIRRLADQTAAATCDIEQMVKEIQAALSAGVMGMDKFSEEVRRGMQDVREVGGQLTQIIHQVKALTPRFEAVSEGMHAQATGAEQISQALTQLSEAARQTVESLRQSDQAIQELNEVSNGLCSGVSRFKLEA